MSQPPERISDEEARRLDQEVFRQNQDKLASEWVPHLARYLRLKHLAWIGYGGVLSLVGVWVIFHGFAWWTLGVIFIAAGILTLSLILLDRWNDRYQREFRKKYL